MKIIRTLWGWLWTGTKFVLKVFAIIFAILIILSCLTVGSATSSSSKSESTTTQQVQTMENSGSEGSYLEC